MPKIHENTTKSLLQRLLQNAMKYKAKTLYNLNGQNTRPKMKEKPIQIFTRKSGPNLGPWAQKSTLRFMRTLRSCLAALTQSSWSLVSNTLGDVAPMWSL